MADDGWICPKGNPKSPEKPSVPFTGSPRSRRYGNLRHAENSSQIYCNAKPRDSSPLLCSYCGFYRRPLTATNDLSCGLAGGEETALVRGDLHSHPPISTTSVGSVGGVEKANEIVSEESLLQATVESPSQISDSWMLLPFPFPQCGDTWDECVAKVEREMQQMEEKWAAEKPKFWYSFPLTLTRFIDVCWWIINCGRPN